MPDFDDDLELEAAIQAEARCGSLDFDANTRVRNKIKAVTHTNLRVLGRERSDEDDEEDANRSLRANAPTPLATSDTQATELPPERKICKDCGTASYSVTFLKAFGLVVCNPCMLERYPLITKSTAKEEFLCTDTVVQCSCTCGHDVAQHCPPPI
jgi:hypothetical protein